MIVFSRAVYKGTSMLFYTSPTGEVFAFETEEDRQTYGPKDLVKMTARQVEDHLNPPPKLEDLQKQARFQRDVALQDVLWKVERHSQEQALQLEPSLSAQQYLALLAYIQALRDYPQQDSWWTLELPQPPA